MVHKVSTLSTVGRIITVATVLGLLTFEEALHAEVGYNLLAGLLFEGFAGHPCHRTTSGGGLCVLIHGNGMLLFGDVGGGQFGLLGRDGLYDAKKPLDINAFGVMPLAIGGDEFVGGTVCPPHERIKLGVAFAKLLEVFGRIYEAKVIWLEECKRLRLELF